MTTTKPNTTNNMKKLIEIQQQLKAPKNQMNKFGNYRYRSAEDILEALKPLLKDCILTLSDEMVEIGGRVYVKATATIADGTNVIKVTAFAREEETKKGMDGSQITGAASSYARKYALNGLFLIDDTKDSDATNDHGKVVEVEAEEVNLPKLSVADAAIYDKWVKWFAEGKGTDAQKMATVKRSFVVGYDAEKKFFEDIATYKINHNIQ